MSLPSLPLLLPSLSLLNLINEINDGEFFKWPPSPWVLVAQWIERPPGVQEVVGGGGDNNIMVY